MPDIGLTSGQTRWIRTLLDSAALSAESEPDKDRSKASVRTHLFRSERFFGSLWVSC
jgi:hypothetical protein